MGLLYFAPWLRDARPGDMGTILCNDIGSGDWASAGGHNRGGGAALQMPPGSLTQGTRREDPPLQCPFKGLGDVAALTTKTYGGSESESLFLFLGESLWGGTSEL